MITYRDRSSAQQFHFPFLPLILLFPSILASSCSDAPKDAGDAGTDTDIDTDTDTDTNADTDTETYWTWNEVVIPDYPSGICDDYSFLRLWALAEDDVVVCVGNGETRGGLAEFDGSSLSLSVLPSGIDNFECEGVWGNGEDVWAWGHLGWSNVEYSVLRRDGAVWVEEAVAGFGNCATSPDGCFIQAMYTDASGLPHAVGWTDGDWVPPTTGTRISGQKKNAKTITCMPGGRG